MVSSSSTPPPLHQSDIDIETIRKLGLGDETQVTSASLRYWVLRSLCSFACLVEGLAEGLASKPDAASQIKKATLMDSVDAVLPEFNSLYKRLRLLGCSPSRPHLLLEQALRHLVRSHYSLHSAAAAAASSSSMTSEAMEVRSS